MAASRGGGRGVSSGAIHVDRTLGGPLSVVEEGLVDGPMVGQVRLLKSNVAREFFVLLESCFPKNHKFANIIK